MSIVLIGYRGSGKTTLGQLLAQRLNRPFLDTDDWITRRAGCSIADIFARHGETHFRQIEHEAVLHAAQQSNHVIALGGGALHPPANRHAFAAPDHRIVYLRCEPHELLRRIQADAARGHARPPLTAHGGNLEEIRQVLAEREPIWREVMTHQLNVTSLSPEQAADALIPLL